MHSFLFSLSTLEPLIPPNQHSTLNNSTLAKPTTLALASGKADYNIQNSTLPKALPPVVVSLHRHMPIQSYLLYLYSYFISIR